MNKNARPTWPKDFETGLSMVPPGEFTDFSSFPNSSLPARVRKLPVLRGWFEAAGYDMNPDLPMHIGWGAVLLENSALALTFRIQRGSSILYWLANPADKRVWEVLDKWSAAGQIVVAVEFADRPALLVSRDFKLAPQISELRIAVGAADLITPKFVASASLAILKDEVRLFAISDIPAYPKLDHFQACMVRTEETGGVALMLNDKAPGANGMVADAAASLAEAMLRPDQARH